MSQLPAPIKEGLRDPVDDLLPQRVWRRMAIKAKRVEQSRVGARRFRVLIAAASLAVFAAVAVLVFQPGDLDHAELRLTGGELPEVLAVPQNAGPEAYDFADGTRVILMPDTTLSSLANGTSEIILLLEHGRASFEVPASEPRRWTIECGLATIEVLGGRFYIERREDGLRVAVEDGAVLVRGERVANRVQRLTKGSSLELGPVRPPPASDLEEASAPEDSAVRRKILAALEPRPHPRVRAKADEPVSADAEAHLEKDEPAPAKIDESPPIVREDPVAPVMSAGALMELADKARVRGDYRSAAELLSTIVHDHKNDPRSPVAAFMLGRVELENLDRPRDAAISFELALSLDLPLALREVALAHLAGAYDRAGARKDARPAAEKYLAEYPQGRRAEDMMRILETR